ncbi:MAG: 3-deoxy-8-phosphooctulonate synthase [Pirellulaceae bacterium]|nr:3-deoxy-8-phosphooctulonate synthase [Pirellulaceae bacterium]MDP7017972.1 3-deoxy-8-phosphooctulonate synthase [Pirellulaceae bacterium]
MSPARAVTIGPYRCGADQPLLLIAGPCVLETRDKAREIAAELSAAASELNVQLVFKASFDKANRTSVSSYRGPGLAAGLEILGQIRDEFGVPVTTDIHESHQAAAAAEVCELLQIPAFLARQTDLLQAAAETGRAVNIKKGQFLAPSDMQHVVDKVVNLGNANVLLCERGTFFGYGKLVNDMKSLVEMRRFAPVVFDATHSVQEPGGLGGATGGNRAMIEPLARAAIAVGVDGLFFETHPRPEESPSDGPNMVPLSEFRSLLQRLLTLRATVETLK